MMNRSQLIETGIRHLPPSPADLHLLDVGGIAHEHLAQRHDIVPHIASLRLSDWHVTPASMDAVMTLDYPLHPDFLQQALNALRPGGRLVMLQTVGQVDEHHGQTLAHAGFVRLLIEQATPQGGLLLRGERAHTTHDTHERVQATAQRDADAVDWNAYRGRYVHLLIRQSPNKPVWKLSPDERLTWRAVTAHQADTSHLLAFSSLPKAVAFMQPAVLQGIIQDVNKVAKFSLATASAWRETLGHDVLLNPTLESVAGHTIAYIDIDPHTAEQPDE